MFRLKKSSEEKFNYFRNTNFRYIENTDKIVSGSFGFIGGILAIIYLFTLFHNIDIKTVLGSITIILIVTAILFKNINKLGLKRYLYKYQKSVVTINLISAILFSLSAYLFPLIFIYIEENNSVMKQIMICAILVGFMYIFMLLIKICKLIKKGETKSDECENIYGLLGKKLATMGVGCSIPVIVVASKLSHTMMIQMNSNIGMIVLGIITAFILQLVISISIPECIILLYCKFRFESFNIPYK